MQISTVGGGETISDCRSLLKRKRMVESQDGDSLGQVTQLTETIIQSEGGEEEEEEVDMEGGGHVTPDGSRRTMRVSKPPHCGTGGHLQKKHGDTNHEKVVDAARGRGGGRDLEQHILATGATNVGSKYISCKVCKTKLLRLGLKHV
ncbi:hypothetical protein RHMOL_Rhmol01G0207100 [Rhododendron molle]|uniref:Uncharacterized protein n=1 Tax=Rhododendron molle TaxID=49168 RepID=A0ACC0Q541_RHOML|nr:hypothetical protein RHMOL_Rhmol01G0207100 [Rhododendron molle]